jgi:hypothetical protein
MVFQKGTKERRARSGRPEEQTRAPSQRLGSYQPGGPIGHDTFFMYSYIRRGITPRRSPAQWGVDKAVMLEIATG